MFPRNTSVQVEVVEEDFDITAINKKYGEINYFNPLISEGYVYATLKDPISIFKGYLRQIEPCFVEGLKITNVRMAEPREDIRASFIKTPGKGGPKLKVDQNHLFMVVVEYTYFGNRQPNLYMRAPFYMRGSRIVLDNSVFYHLPVLAENGVEINRSKKEMYIDVRKTSTPVYVEEYTFRVNSIPYSDSVIVAEFHEAAKKAKSNGMEIPGGKVGIKPSLFMYLMMNPEYNGVINAIKHYFDMDVELLVGDMTELVEANDQTQYTIFSSFGSRPRGLEKERWVDPNIHLRFKGEMNGRMREIAANFFYIYDQFTGELNVEQLLETNTWRYLAGRIIFKNDIEGFAKKLVRVNEHMEKFFDVLIDEGTKLNLAEKGIFVNDAYEYVLWYIINEKESFANHNPSSFANKLLVSEPYAFSDVATSINRLGYKLDTLRRGNVKLSEEKLHKLMRGYIKEGLFRTLKSDHGEVVTIQSSSPIMWFYTRNVIPQGKAKNRGRSGMEMKKEENLGDATIYGYANIAYIPKSGSHRKGTINPHLKIMMNGLLVTSSRVTRIMHKLSKRLGYSYTINLNETNVD